MQTIDEKITAIIKHFNLTNFSFSKRINVTGTTIDSIVNGRPQPNGSRKKTKPGYDVLTAIINEFNINPDYLFNQSSLMLKSDREEFKSYSGVPKVVTVDKTGKENVVFVPIQARAGYLNGYSDSLFIESLPTFNIPYLTNGTYRCFEVSGNSMINTVFDGDLVFGKCVEDLSDIKDGHLYVVVSNNDGVVLKRVINKIKEDHRLILNSDNKDGNYPSYSIEGREIRELWHITMYASKKIPEPFDIYNRLHKLELKVEGLDQSQFKN